MITREIDVEVVANSFPGKITPTNLQGPATVPVNVAESLLMLGTMTSPSGFSVASPARYWAWIRYFSAIHSSNELRVTAPFVDLDPHQRGILSDDLGVAITIKWLHDRLGGFAEIVDGRRFMLQYAALLSGPRKKKKRKTPKVGIGKCPDYVVRDYANRWHVVECKGTQTSYHYRNAQLKTALEQKKVIDVATPIRGHRLALGLYLGNERDAPRSELRVMDPKVEPYVTVTDRDSELAETAQRRLAASRALALSGFDALAEELSLPPESDRFGEDELRALFSSEERRRLTRPFGERMSDAMKELRSSREAKKVELGGERYSGSEILVEIPGESFRSMTGCSRVRVFQGTRTAFLERVRDIPSDYQEGIDSAAYDYLATPRVQFFEDGFTTTLIDGDLFAARLELLK